VVADALLDAMAANGTITHARQVADLTLTRGAPGSPGYLIVQITPLPPDK
jgi:hypothetical protein